MQSANSSLESMTLPLNCLSIDVEGFLESNLESFGINGAPHAQAREDDEITRNLDVTLELLQEAGVRATFFFLGRVARHIPQAVRQVASEGHEIASHGDEHRRLFGLRPADFHQQMDRSKKTLEDLAGSAVLGFRAPEFSITRKTWWALDVLRDLGFAYDSSIYPIGLHDVYGMAEAEPDIHVLENGIIEFPLPLFSRSAGGFHSVAVDTSGSTPLSLTRACVRAANRSGRACMVYLHPYEIGPVIPRVAGLSRQRRFRHYHNVAAVPRRLSSMLRQAKFAPAVKVLRTRNLLVA
ncbi:MAG TPA: DUF3473 domain-containing protein [Aestuariivirgaceae bacterium]|nr:DUF3473 domain-containing protein [Aestuariivirgaceae bacterium]